MKTTTIINGKIADAIGAWRLQQLADDFTAAAKEQTNVRVRGPSSYHEGKVFEGRLIPPPPYKSWLVEARIGFRVTARSLEEAQETALGYLDADDLIGTYSDVIVPGDAEPLE